MMYVLWKVSTCLCQGEHRQTLSQHWTRTAGSWRATASWWRQLCSLQQTVQDDRPAGYQHDWRLCSQREEKTRSVYCFLFAWHQLLPQLHGRHFVWRQLCSQIKEDDRNGRQRGILVGRAPDCTLHPTWLLSLHLWNNKNIFWKYLQGQRHEIWFG